MVVPRVVCFLLALSVVLALPLAVVAVLWGAHVTPEQGLWHQAAVARQGEHVHTWTAGPADHHGPAAPATANPVADTGWLDRALGALVKPVSPIRWLGRLPAALAPPSHIPAVALPPPRHA